MKATEKLLSTEKDIATERRVGRHLTNEPGLYLNVSPAMVKSWVFRIRVKEGGESKPVQRGFGVFPSVTFAEARQRTALERARTIKGEMPVRVDRGVKAAIREAAKAGEDQFEVVARAFIDRREPQWKDKKSAPAWRNTLALYAFPVIGAKSIPKITVDDCIKILSPIWFTKPETAMRVRSRMECVIGYFIAKHRLPISNPAALAAIKYELAPIPKKKRLKHHPSIEWKQMPAFLRELRTMDSESARGLEFLILTALRTKEVRLMERSQVNFQTKVWTIPAHIMKADVEHRVPLTPRMIEIIKAQPIVDDSPFVFTASRESKNKGKPLSTGAFLELIKPIREAGTFGYFDIHGFRSSFRTWARENKIAEADVVKAASAHQETDEVKAAYERTDFLEARRPLMVAWEQFLKGGKVVSLPKRERALRKAA